MWGESVAWSPTEPLIVRVVQPHLFYQLKRQNGAVVTNDPQNEPKKVAEWVAHEIVDSQIPSGKVCIVLRGFGEESAAFDSINGQPPRFPPSSSTRFYRVEDSLSNILPGDLDDDPSDGRTDRPYKHACLINGGTVPDPNNPGQFLAAPLRVWMEQFVQELWDIKHDTSRAGGGNGVYYPDMPDPERFYFDTEPYIGGPPSMNPLKILVKLWQHPYWNTVQVVGSEGLIDGQRHTMAELYNAAAALHGWPAQLDDWPNGGIWYEAAQAYFDTRYYPNGGVPIANRDVAVWLYRILQRVQDGVMNHCAYDVIRAKWPNAKCGNYEDAFSDGQPDTVTRMQVPPPDLGGVATDQFRRLQVNRFFGGAYWTTATGIWSALPMRASGSQDSPVLYEINYSNWIGFGSYLPGHRQDNLWKSGFPQEDIFESAQRIHRHMVESILNSQPTTGVERLTPWIGMVGTGENGGTLDNFLSRDEARDVLAMLRGKNLKEASYWTNWYRKPDAPSDYENMVTAWEQTREAARRVCAGRVLKYTRTSGPLGFPVPPMDPLRLEFTLREEGNPLREREVELASLCSLPPVGGGGSMQCFNAVVIDVEWKDPLYIEENINTFDLNLESSTNNPGVTGNIYIWSPSNQSYSLFGTPECSTVPPFDFFAPVSAVDTRHRARVALRSVTGPQDSAFVDRDGKLKTRVKIVYTSNSSFRSYTDLFQLIPRGVGGCSSGLMAAQSDFNYDGSITESDLGLYIDEWMYGEESADVNMDSAVNGADLDTYVQSYATGT
jgi:hypothetical protein